LISKALERSSINLYLSQRVSKELSPALHSPDLGSSGEKFYQAPSHLPENKSRTKILENINLFDKALAQKHSKESYLNIIERYQQENPAQKHK